MVKNPLRIVIAQPIYGHVPAEAYQSMLVAFHTAQTLNVLAGFCFVDHTYIDKARNELVHQARALGATHILWVDSDMVIPRDSVQQLVSHGKTIVGGLYHKRKPPYEPVAFSFDPFGSVKLNSSGLQQVDALGFGCTLISMEVFDRLSEPWFVTGYPTDDSAAGYHFLGEDINLFQRVQDLNIPVYLDLDLHCGHISDYVVTHSDFLSHKDEM